jgi:hypothetical protein
MSDGEITVVVEGEDDEVADSATSRIEALNRQADADRAKTARLNLQTAHLRREGALRKVEADYLSTESEAKAAEAAYREAREYGDVDAETKAQRRLAAAEAKRTLLETRVQDISSMPVSSGDPFEDHVSRFTDRTAQWMRDHRDWVEDPRKNAKIVGAHHMAVGDGLEPDTPEYFEHVERQLGLRSGGNGNGSARSGSMRSETKINPGDFNTHVRDGGKSVFLTENERKISTDGTLVWNYGPNKGKPLGTAEFARRKAAQITAGLHNKL